MFTLFVFNTVPKISHKKVLSKTNINAQTKGHLDNKITKQSS